VLQPVRVRSRRPPRVPCSDTRLAGRVTFLRESSGRKSSAAGERCLSRSDRSRRASNRAGHSGANTDSVERWAPTEADVGTLEEPTHCFVEEGDGGRDSAGIWTCPSSRRRGDGTRGRNADPKQGRSRRQPRPCRRAKAFCITNVLGKSGGAGETGGSGRSSGDERDMTTLSERRARGSRWLLEWPEAGWLTMPAEDAGRRTGNEGPVKPRGHRGYADLALYLGGLAGRAWLIRHASA
jgi:hypothetical protein